MSSDPIDDLICARGKPRNWRRDVCDYDPYDGDLGESNNRTITDEVRIARRRGECLTCRGPIVRGALTRVLKGADDDGFYGGRHCEECCDAMALVSAANCGDIEDDDAAFDALGAMELRHAMRLRRERVERE